jgi:hypothetical protein
MYDRNDETNVFNNNNNNDFDSKLIPVLNKNSNEKTKTSKKENQIFDTTAISSNQAGFLSKLNKKNTTNLDTKGILSPEDATEIFVEQGDKMFESKENLELINNVLGKTKLNNILNGDDNNNNNNNNKLESVFLKYDLNKKNKQQQQNNINNNPPKIIKNNNNNDNNNDYLETISTTNILKNINEAKKLLELDNDDDDNNYGDDKKFKNNSNFEKEKSDSEIVTKSIVNNINKNFDSGSSNNWWSDIARKSYADYDDNNSNNNDNNNNNIKNNKNTNSIIDNNQNFIEKNEETQDIFNIIKNNKEINTNIIESSIEEIVFEDNNISTIKTPPPVLSQQEADKLLQKLDNLNDQQIEEVFKNLRNNMKTKFTNELKKNLSQKNNILPSTKPINNEVRKDYEEEFKQIESELSKLYNDPLNVWQNLLFSDVEELEKFSEENDIGQNTEKDDKK